MSETLERLRALTEALPTFSTTLEEQPGFKMHACECGDCMSWNLLSQDEISCARFYNSVGSFQMHAHEQREFLIIYKGSMLITIDGEEEQRLLPGMSCTIDAKVPHRARFLENCWYLAITIPKTDDWPE